jgi:hypothetical protein
MFEALGLILSTGGREGERRRGREERERKGRGERRGGRKGKE